MDFGALKLQPRLLLLLAFFLFPLSNASLHVYQHDAFREVGNSLLLSGGSEGIIASSSSLSSSPPVLFSVHDGRSFIRFENITFQRSEGNSGLVQVVIFEAADRDRIGGSAYGGQRSLCCTSDLANLEGCKEGEVIKLQSSTDDKWPMVLDVKFHGNSLTAEMDNMDILITNTGMYNLFFISCDEKLKGLVMNGQTLWKNPDGYLPGRMAPLMKFYIIMSYAYVLLSFLWFFQYVRFWKEILQLQHCITLVIALSWFEMILWYFDYANFNNSGIRPVAITSWVVTVGALRRTVSRLLILCVSMGYGVVRPTLGGLTSKVILLGITYFLATELLGITEYVGTINDIAGRAKLLLVLPNVCLDAFLILWIFTSLSKTLEQLQEKRSAVKLDTYRKFSNALAVAVIASVAWISYEVYFKATDPYNERWQSAWIITAYWDILAYAVICVICYLWAPSQSSQRYAYSNDIGELDDEETQSLTRAEGDVSLVNHPNQDTKIVIDDSCDFEDENEADKGQ